MHRSTSRGLTVALLFVTAAYAVAEEITLTTYYPSPRGVYETLRTTGQTTLAELTGNVGIGTTTPTGKLHVAGAGNSLFMNTGNVGIATSTPSEKLDVAGNINLTGDIEVGGGDILSTGAGTLNISNGGAIRLDTTTGVVIGPTTCPVPTTGTGIGGFNVCGPVELFHGVDIGTVAGSPAAGQLRVQFGVEASTLKITGGAPAAGKVLTAVDDTGLTTWGAGGGGLTFEMPTSCVKDGDPAVAGFKTCSTGLSSASWVCALIHVNQGGCDSGMRCSVGNGGGSWFVQVVSDGDCDVNPSCQAVCFQ